MRKTNIEGEEDRGLQEYVEWRGIIDRDRANNDTHVILVVNRE